MLNSFGIGWLKTGNSQIVVCIQPKGGQEAFMFFKTILCNKVIEPFYFYFPMKST